MGILYKALRRIFGCGRGGTTITGDLGEEGELALVEKYKGTDVLDCDILKVSYHGSRYSSCNEFLRAVSPKIALIGVGKKNTYGHPTGEVIERCGTDQLSCSFKNFRAEKVELNDLVC